MGEDETDLRNFRQDASRKQLYLPLPRKMGAEINKLLARRGFTKVKSAASFTAIWEQCVGEKFARDTRTGNLNRGVLEIFTRNSAVLQELTFNKKAILKKLTTLAVDHKIRDLRLKVGAVD